MSQSESFKDKVLLVNLDMTTTTPAAGTQNGTDGNFYIRNNYSSTDVFRSLLQNQYWRVAGELVNVATETLYRTADGPLIVALAVITNIL